MLHGPILKKMILFALPLAASSILQMLFNMADTAVVGRFAGSRAMAAVGGNGPLINLLVSLFIGLSVGVNVVVARFIGQKNSGKIHSAVHTTVLLALICGVILMAAGLLLAKPLLEITGVPESIMGLAELYLRIYFLGTPFTVLYNFCASILRSKGDSKRPLYILMLTGCINVALNLVFVILFHLSVAGVAIATMIANMISSLLVIFILTREKEPFRLRRKDLLLDRSIVRDIVRIGVPAGLQGMVFSFSNTVIQSGINSLGPDVIAGSAAALNFEGIGYFGINAFSQAGTTFTGQNFGAGDVVRCRKVFTRALVCGMLCCLALNMICILFQDPLLGLFTTETAVIRVGKVRMMRVLAFQWLAATYEVSGSILRGMGYSMVPTILTVFGTCVIRIIWVFTVFQSWHTFAGLVAVYPVSWALTGFMVMGAYFLIRRKVFAKMAQTGA